MGEKKGEDQKEERKRRREGLVFPGIPLVNLFSLVPCCTLDHSSMVPSSFEPSGD